MIDRCIERLPERDSKYRLEDVLIGGGEALVRNAETERLIRSMRQRFPKGPQETVNERRASGHVILALQSTGLPLASSHGEVRAAQVEYWLDLGVDYFQVASSDMFHRRQRPAYPWDTLEANLAAYGKEHGIEFLIYGKGISKLVPSGRVLDSLDELEAEGASLLTDERYCADGWETASHFLSGSHLSHPDCSEVVIDPDGWVHPCCWYTLSPGLFPLGEIALDEGMERMQDIPFCRALDEGDIHAVAVFAGIPAELARRVRDAVGDCGACRLFVDRLSRRDDYSWMRVSPLSDRELTFYRQSIGSDLASLGA